MLDASEREPTTVVKTLPSPPKLSCIPLYIKNFASVYLSVHPSVRLSIGLTACSTQGKRNGRRKRESSVSGCRLAVKSIDQPSHIDRFIDFIDDRHRLDASEWQSTTVVRTLPSPSKLSVSCHMYIKSLASVCLSVHLSVLLSVGPTACLSTKGRRNGRGKGSVMVISPISAAGQ